MCVNIHSLSLLSWHVSTPQRGFFRSTSRSSPPQNFPMHRRCYSHAMCTGILQSLVWVSATRAVRRAYTHKVVDDSLPQPRTAKDDVDALRDVKKASQQLHSLQFTPLEEVSTVKRRQQATAEASMSSSDRSSDAQQAAAVDQDIRDHDLAYTGYTTPEIQRMKRTVLSRFAATADVAAQIPRLRQILAEFVETASGDAGFITRADCNHVRFILVLCYRRASSDVDMAENLLWEILREEPWNVDAVEGLLELAVVTEDAMKRKLNPILTFLQEKGRLELGFTILADIMTTAVGESLRADGEGSAMVYTMRILSTLASICGQERMSLFLDFLFNSFDELHFGAVMAAKHSDAEFPLQVVVVFLKTMAARRLFVFSSDALQFEFQVYSKLFSALHELKRKQEAHAFAERVIEMFRRYPQELADQFDTYKATLFTHVHDRAHDAPVVARQLCIAAIEEFPDDAAPWKTLALVLQRDGELDNAVVAAKKALAIDPSDFTSLLLLASLFDALKKPSLAEAVRERFKLLQLLVDEAASADDQHSVLQDALALEAQVVEADPVAELRQERAAQEEQYNDAHRYTKHESAVIEPVESWDNNWKQKGTMDPSLGSKVPEAFGFEGKIPPPGYHRDP